MQQIESFLKFNLKHEDFEIKDLIAAGSFGDVFQAINKKINNKIFAIKVMSLRPSDIKENEESAEVTISGEMTGTYGI